MREDLEVLKKLSFIRSRLKCKCENRIQADLCNNCQGVTESGKTVEEVMDELEKNGFFKKIRSARKIGALVGKSAFWAGKALIAGGVSYVIYLVGKEIFAYTKKKKKKKRKKSKF